ncbi:Nucleic acid-binding proteins superfamily [Striga hermonthica]|uniref:Nucleic acid-binding proteins superfamily n=1 Tax=Striga hermonthica TaxID=68872 RepID=A0A9N7ND05_STRHE|nr:Nucleic acid-binding proteins superfamily [Striga hermonthica]
MFIVDDTGIMQVLCWDKIANELIGKSCEEVLQDMLKHDDGSDLPIELSALKDKALLFKVGKKKDQLKPYNGAFIVSRITADPILVNRFGGLENAQQEFDFAQGELSISYKPKSEVVDDSAKSGSKKKLSDEVTSIDEDSKGKKKIKIEGL